MFAETKRNVPCPYCGRWKPGENAVGKMVLGCLLNFFLVCAIVFACCAIAAFSGEDEATARLIVRVAAFLPLIAACMGIYWLRGENENPERTLRTYDFNKLNITLESAPTEKKTELIALSSEISLAKRLGAALLFAPAILSGYWAVCATPGDALGTAGIPGLAVAATFLAAFSVVTFKMANVAEPKIEVEDVLLEARSR